ncbi:hypothetical protein SLA_5103 [Streptomyces laurentii]|uniref:Uncharacterized protein n=1 Tax=Streptomyces laurentii TaxID=39478 RepID=A0A160P4Y6_STRLU|nr:hypothetical protein SLA_5103 [Streptomyces laurentii]
MEPATAMAATAARREVRVLATAVLRVERAVMVGFLRRVRELPGVAYESSSAATSCDYGILPFGLPETDGHGCQNRITGGSGPSVPSPPKAKPSSEGRGSHRKFSCLSRYSDEKNTVIRVGKAPIRTSGDVSNSIRVWLRSV